MVTVICTLAALLAGIVIVRAIVRRISDDDKHQREMADWLQWMAEMHEHA